MDCHLDLVSERSNPLLKEIKEELHQLTDKYYFMLQILQGSDWALEDEEDREGEEHQAIEDPQHPIYLHSSRAARILVLYPTK